MTTKLTIDLGEEVTAFICADSAKRGITVDQYLTELIREVKKEALEYEKARLEFMELCKQPWGATSWEGGRRPTREEIYDERLSRFR